MKYAFLLLAALSLAMTATQTSADTAQAPTPAKNASPSFFQPEAKTTEGTVTVNGHDIDYKAVAGTLVVHAKGWNDAARPDDKSNPDAEASMFYVAYFKKGAKADRRPIMFLYNGGPGSASIWLHMGAFGPRRVVTNNDSQTPAAPYKLVNNAQSLLDVSDLVFIDAPGTGFSRIAGKNKEKAFYGVDQDVHAFAEFITQFLSKYGRWNSPKYLFGESYGTPRSAALANVLEQDKSVDLNGVILLSQILNFDLSVDEAEFNPGIDLPYELALPSYAATAWYHHRLPGNPPALKPLLAQVENFAMTDYAIALQKGSTLSPQERDTIAEKLHDYTGLSVAYIEKANLRVTGGEFEKTLQSDDDLTTGRLDSRFSGPTMDPLSKDAEYDPQSAAISSAYIAAFNNYVRKDLDYGQGKTYKPVIDIFKAWDFKHKPPGAPFPLPMATNVMSDLAAAMKYDPDLQVMLNQGYFDLATPFYEGIYEMHHLPMPAKLQANIEYRQYESGHMVYANLPSLKKLHDNVADFIRRTDHLGDR